eukprot:1276672-Rhodomonas_salina.4
MYTLHNSPLAPPEAARHLATTRNGWASAPAPASAPPLSMLLFAGSHPISRPLYALTSTLLRAPPPSPSLPAPLALSPPHPPKPSPETATRAAWLMVALPDEEVRPERDMLSLKRPEASRCWAIMRSRRWVSDSCSKLAFSAACFFPHSATRSARNFTSCPRHPRHQHPRPGASVAASGWGRVRHGRVRRLGRLPSAPRSAYLATQTASSKRATTLRVT